MLITISTILNCHKITVGVEHTPCISPCRNFCDRICRGGTPVISKQAEDDREWTLYVLSIARLALQPISIFLCNTHLHSPYWDTLHVRHRLNVQAFLFTKDPSFNECLSTYLLGQAYTARHTVCLLTHVICKPSHFFLQLFIVTMSNSIQKCLNNVMKDWRDKYHV